MPPRKAMPRPKLTHFLCIPLITATSRPQLQTALQRFRQDVINDKTPENPDGIPEKALRPLGSLHLTLGVMSLLTQERVDTALSLLRSLNTQELLGPPTASAAKSHNSGSTTEMKEGSPVDEETPLSVTLQGLSSMHDPSKTSIMYVSPVDPNGRLLAFCNRLKEVFSSANLLVPDDRQLLLHATIVNTIYVPGIHRKCSGSGHGKSRTKLTLDAREIMERFESVEWMKDVKIEKIAICRMGAKKVVDEK